MTDTQHFTGTCDVCGATINYDHDPRSGVIDIGVTDEGVIYTWIRHYATTPEGANPACAIYSSRVYATNQP